MKNKVIRCIADVSGVDAAKIDPSTTLEEGLGMDSLDVIELSMELEDQFCILIEDEAAGKCKTVADVIALVEATVMVAA